MSYVKDVEYFSLVAVGAIVSAGSVSAATTVSAQLSGNDCSGTFSSSVTGQNGFSYCDVGNDLGDDDYAISAVVAKYEPYEAAKPPTDNKPDGTPAKPANWELNSLLYPTVQSSQFTLTGAGDASTEAGISGTWSYNQLVGTPSIRFWVAKAGNDFNLFWNVADGTGFDADNYNQECLEAAIVSTTGDWSTLGQMGLSHITFYNCGPGVNVVPLPAAGWMLIVGLGAMGAMRRRKKS